MHHRPAPTDRLQKFRPPWRLLLPLSLPRPAVALLLAELTGLFASTLGHGAALWWLGRQAGARGLTAYAAWMALVALLSLPLLSPLGDRADKRRVLLCGQTLLVLEALVLALVGVTGGLSLTTLCACGAVATMAAAVVQPALSSLLLETVPPDQLTAAIRVRRGAQAVGTLGGPALAGLALAGGAVGGAFACQALLAMAAGVCVTRLPARAAGARGHRSASWRADLVAGLQAKWRVRVDRWWSFAGALMMIFFGPATGLLLPLRLQAMGASAAWFGLCGSALSVGVLAGVLGLADACMARLGRVRAMGLAITLCGLSIGLVGLVNHPGGLALCFGLIGLCLSVTQLMGQTHRALAVPEDFRARMASAQLTLSHLASLVAPLLAGLCLQHWPVAPVYGLMCGGFLLSGLALLVVPDLRAFLSTSPAEAAGWYERRYPDAFRRGPAGTGNQSP